MFCPTRHELIKDEVMEITDLIKKAHDELLASSDLEHDESLCEICSKAQSSPGGNVSDKTFTKEEVEAQVAAALAPLQAQLDELLEAKSGNELEEKIAEAKKELEEQIAALQTELDAAKIAQAAAETKATEAESQYADLTTYLEATQAEADAAAELEAKKAERVEAVKEAASFDDEYLAANADRWASMDEELFTATLEDYKGLVAKAGTPAPKKETVLPSGTVLETASADGAKTSALSHIAELREVGYDPRKSY